MNHRTVFDRIPEQFDQWRPRYCPELFADLIAYANLGPGKTVLEIGPGTGQATAPIVETGCTYTAIELSGTFADILRGKFGGYPNVQIVNADFETYDFPPESFDLVYSAAAFQWIPETIGYPKAYAMLKRGGAFAMFLMRPDIQPGGGYTDAALYTEIQKVYTAYFHPETPYRCSLDYEARERYGFTALEHRAYRKTRTYSADDYLSLIGTHSDHITLKEPYRSQFFAGIRAAIEHAGGQITLYDKITLYLARKP